MKVYLNRKVVMGPYGGGNNFVRAFYEFAEKSPGVTVESDQTMRINPDVVLLAGLANEGPECISAEQAIMWKLYNPSCKLVLRVNECDARKGTLDVDEMLVKVSAHVDGTVFVSEWLRDYFMSRGWACKDNTVIVNGVQRSIFKPGTKFADKKLHIVAHHWSDNALKGADIYQRLDQFIGDNPNKFAFTYVGRHQCDFKHTTVVRPLHGKSLGEELGKHDVYVSGSRFDPGPNHVLEALACELPTYVHRDGGGCVEFAGFDHSYRNWNDLEAILLARGGPLNTAIKLQPWADCVAQYAAYLEQVTKT